MKSFFCFISIVTALFSNVNAQSEFYDINEIRNIRLYFQQQNWDQLLDSFYIIGDEERILASVVVDGLRFDSVGVRYKGFSSVSTERKKNPFNIKLDYVKNQSYQGYEKIKLSNVIQDPSFVREALSYEIARKYMPASQANFANVYVNDTFWGVYTNVEAVNKHFLAERFGSSENAFFKGNPDDLDLNGENCNLNNLYGLDSSKYMHLYDIKSDNGWGSLMTLMDILNDSSKSVSDVLNVDRALWMHAFNYVFVNFDSYIGYAQNYYLYKTDDGLYIPILWDLNQSFGSFRLTDCSSFFRGFTVKEAALMDPLTHLNSFSVHPRPLITNLLKNETYKRMYLAHIRTIVKENLSNHDYYTRATAIQSLIRKDVYADQNKFYSNTDFDENLDSTVKDLIEYPGIMDLMEKRSEYFGSYPGMIGYPFLINHEVAEIQDSIDISLFVENASSVVIKYRSNASMRFSNLKMLDDGLHGDGSAYDMTYGVRIAMSDIEQYYFYAENDSAGSFLPERAAHEYFTLNTNLTLVVNELCANNKSTISDEEGAFDDWLEFYNNGTSPIALSSYYLSDDETQLEKWKLPDVTIEPNEYFLVWLDGETSQGDLHANFKLSASGEQVLLSDESGNIIDHVTFGRQIEDVSYGRIPNGTGAFTYNEPTPRLTNEAFNGDLNIKSIECLLYPNPASSVVRLLFSEKIDGDVEIYTVGGRQVVGSAEVNSEWSWNYDVTDFVKGLYILKLTTNNTVITKKFILK